MGRTFEQPGLEVFAKINAISGAVDYLTFEELYTYYTSIEDVERKVNALKHFNQFLQIANARFGIVNEEVIVRL